MTFKVQQLLSQAILTVSRENGLFVSSRTLSKLIHDKFNENFRFSLQFNIQIYWQKKIISYVNSWLALDIFQFKQINRFGFICELSKQTFFNFQFIKKQRKARMLIRKILFSTMARIIKTRISQNPLVAYASVNNSFKQTIQVYNKSQYQPFNTNLSFCFSKQKILESFQKLQQQIQLKQMAKKKQQQQNLNKKSQHNLFLQKQQKIVKDFLELTQDSFSQHLQADLQHQYLVDPHILLMILSSLQDSDVIRDKLPKLYPFISVLDKKELLLLTELILAYRPEILPSFTSFASRPLQQIEQILLILSQLYPKQQKIIQWLKQIPLYKGSNIYILTAGYFSIYQKLSDQLKYKNQRLLQKCSNRIIDIAIDQTEQTKVSMVILAFQSELTAKFGQDFLIAFQNIDFLEIDPLKMQLMYIYLQKYLSSSVYEDVRKHLKSKTKYKILSEDDDGQVEEKIQEEYHDEKAHKYQLQNSVMSPQQMTQIDRYYFLNRINRQLVLKIMDLNWKQVIKLNLLLQYWKLFQSFPKHYPWSSFKQKLVAFTLQRQITNKFTNLSIDEILQILEIMQKTKMNKHYLLMRCLALLSEKLDSLNSEQYIRLSKICVTYVRQCEDYLIGLRREIQKRKFIFKNQDIDRLNQIFRRVLVLFPRPLAK